MPRIVSECGIRLAIVECLPNAKIDGVCFWLNKYSPVIGLSMRFDQIDNFWFVLRHEIEHVLRRDCQTKRSSIFDIDARSQCPSGDCASHLSRLSVVKISD